MSYNREYEARLQRQREDYHNENVRRTNANHQAEAAQRKARHDKEWREMMGLNKVAPPLKFDTDTGYVNKPETKSFKDIWGFVSIVSGFAAGYFVWRYIDNQTSPWIALGGAALSGYLAATIMNSAQMRAIAKFTLFIIAVVGIFWLIKQHMAFSGQ